MLKYIVVAFFTCFIIDLLVIWFSKRTFFGLDNLNGEPQKFHTIPTPRLGGLGIFFSFFMLSLLIFFHRKEINFLMFAISSSVVFFAGLIEDITRKVKPSIRLISAMISAALGIYLLGGLLPRLNIVFIDTFFEFKAFAVFVTLVAVTGVSNAFNIIDGYNGLASMVSVIIFSSFAYVAFKLNDMFLVEICFFMIFATLAFFILNYPTGKIFLGDGGAYFIGFMVAEVSILIVAKHKQVSAFFPLLLCIYPIFETIFSIYRRRKKTRGSSALKPDALHLHQLLYKRLMPHIINPKFKNNLLYRNSSTSPLLWFLTTISALPAILFWSNTKILVASTILCVVIYVSVYKGITGFKMGKIIKNVFAKNKKN